MKTRSDSNHSISISDRSSAEKYIHFCKYLALILFPIILLLFSFVRVERKITTTGIVKAAEQLTVNSQIKDTLVKEIYVTPGRQVIKGEPILSFFDNQFLNNEKESTLSTISNLELEGSLFTKIYSTELHKPVKKMEYEKIQALLDQKYIYLKKIIEEQKQLLALAPIDGTIVKIMVREQGNVEIGTPLYEISQESGTYVLSYVPEKLFALTHQNQHAYLKSQIYNYMWYSIFNGKVSYVSKFAEKDPITGQNVFEIHIKMLDGFDYLQINSSVQCEIIRDKVNLIQYVFNTK